MKCIKDKYGVKLKYPTRSCKECGKYPCFEGIKKCKSDMAKYGCLLYSRLRDTDTARYDV